MSAFRKLQRYATLLHLRQDDKSPLHFNGMLFQGLRKVIGWVELSRGLSHFGFKSGLRLGLGLVN